ncbi:MAG: Hsp33 family molecular chaperone HslO [Eubacteriales bacterium]|nr:Hsp33 family molecular chaperone HslO [Eubacteriales bacterium]
MENDRIVSGLLAQDAVRFTAIDGRAIVAEARETHDLSRVCSAALGRTLLCAAMMGAQLKNQEDRLSVIIKGGGPAGNIVCSTRLDGADVRVKGYIENPALELPLAPNGKLDVSTAVGWFGELVVTRDLSMREPYVGHVPMVSGEIAEDFAQYFSVSEQQPSMVYLGVHVAASDGRVLSAGGVIVQPLPNCPDAVLDDLQSRAAGVGALAGMLETMPLEQAVAQLFADMDMRVTQTRTPYYRCDCSRERLERVLVSLGNDELADMIEKERHAQLTCQFCNATYDFDENELEQLRREASEKQV